MPSSSQVYSLKTYFIDTILKQINTQESNICKAHLDGINRRYSKYLIRPLKYCIIYSTNQIIEWLSRTKF